MSAIHQRIRVGKEPLNFCVQGHCLLAAEFAKHANRTVIVMPHLQENAYGDLRYLGVNSYVLRGLRETVRTAMRLNLTCGDS